MSGAGEKDDNRPVDEESVPTSGSGPGIVGIGEQIGRYKLLRILGEGGFGIVYLAEQQRPMKRQVALKIIKPGMDSAQVIRRFEAERQALALLDHPNVAHVYDAGTTKFGRPYFAMEYVKGVPITEHCDRQKLTIEERLKLFGKVCEAIQHAHQKGIIHRDIKPSNIQVCLQGEQVVPKVIDFGVAKALSQPLTERTLVTEQGQLIGTPEYISPEQAEMTNQDIDTRSDIYSLGVLLYELLTGTLPFESQTLRKGSLEQMRAVLREEEPKTPSTRVSSLDAEASTKLAKCRQSDADTLRRKLRGDLDWITLKAMEKDRTRRYQTAHTLAEDIERHLKQEPVLAGRPGTFYRFQKLVRRNKAVFAGVAVVAAVLVLGVAVSTWQAVRARQAEDKAEKARGSEAAQRQKAEVARAAEAQLRRQAEAQAYASDMNLAQQALAVNNLGRAQELLDRHRPRPGETDLRGWEWRYLWSRCQGDEIFTDRKHENLVTCVAFSPNGRLLATGGRDRTVKVFDVDSKKLVATLHSSGGEIWRNALSFSPDGKCLAVADGKNVTVWETGRWEQPLHTLECAGRHGATTAATVPICFSPSGDKLAAVGTGGLHVWDTTSWQPEHLAFGEIGSSAGAIAYSADGKTLAISESDGDDIQLWDIGAQKELGGSPIRFDCVTCLAFSSRGDLLAASSYGGDVLLWSATTGREIRRWKPHPNLTFGLAFSPDGKTLATGGRDQLIRLWDVASQDRPLSTLRGHQNEIWGLAFSPDGTTLASACKDGTAKLWRPRPKLEEKALTGSRMPIWFSHDGSRLITIDGENDHLQLWELPARKLVRTVAWHGTDGSPCGLEIAPDGKTLAVGLTNGIVQFWDLATERRQAAYQLSDGEVTSLAFSPDNRLLAHSSRLAGGPGIGVFAVAERREIARFSNVYGPVALSPDGELLAAAGEGDSIQLLSVASESELAAFKGHQWGINVMVFSQDGRFLISGSIDNTARIWDVAAKREVGVLRGHQPGLHAVAVSPDGKTIATASSDMTVRLWSFATYEQLLTLWEFDEDTEGLLFSPDGSTLAVGRSGAASAPRPVQIWTAPSWAEIEAAERQETGDDQSR